MSIFTRHNEKLLLSKGFHNLVSAIRVIALILNFISSSFYLFAFQLNFIGIALANIISSSVVFLLFVYFVYENDILKDKSLALIDTDCLDNNAKFYKTCINGLNKSLIYQLKGMTYDLIVLGTIPLGETAIVSNIFAVYYVRCLITIAVSFFEPLRNKFGFFDKENEGENRINIEGLIRKSKIALGCVYVCFIIFNVFFASTIVMAVTNDALVTEEFGRIAWHLNLFFLFEVLTKFMMELSKGLSLKLIRSFILYIFTFVIFVPLGFLFAYVYQVGYFGFWMAIFLSWVVKLAILVSFWRFGEEKEMIDKVLSLWLLADRKTETKITKMLKRRESLVK